MFNGDISHDPWGAIPVRFSMAPSARCRHGSEGQSHCPATDRRLVAGQRRIHQRRLNTKKNNETPTRNIKNSQKTSKNHRRPMDFPMKSNKSIIKKHQENHSTSRKSMDFPKVSIDFPSTTNPAKPGGRLPPSILWWAWRPPAPPLAPS